MPLFQENKTNKLFFKRYETEKLRKMEKQIHDFVVKCEKRRIFATERAT